MKHFCGRMGATVSVSAALLAIVISTVAPNVSAQDARTQALERQLKQLEASLQAVRGELDQVKADSAREAQKLMRIEEKSTSMEKRETLDLICCFSVGVGRVAMSFETAFPYRAAVLAGREGGQIEMHGTSAQVLILT